ncbi:RNA 3'-phosphate cyclase, partial [bacterium]
ERVGFHPRGGGKISAAFRPAPLRPIRRIERGERKIVTATVTISDNLPPHILERAQSELESRAEKAGWPLRTVLLALPSYSPGMAVHLDAVYEGGAGGFTMLGRKGLSTERVVADAWSELHRFDETGATVDEHLADQLLLPALFADGPSEYRTSRVTEHLRTMAWLVPQFGVGEVEIDETTGLVRVQPSNRS